MLHQENKARGERALLYISPRCPEVWLLNRQRFLTCTLMGAPAFQTLNAGRDLQKRTLLSRFLIPNDSHGVFGLLCSTFQNGLSRDNFTSRTQGYAISVSQGPTLPRSSLQTQPCCCALLVCLSLMWAPAHPGWTLFISHSPRRLTDFVHPTNVKCQ